MRPELARSNASSKSKLYQAQILGYRANEIDHALLARVVQQTQAVSARAVAANGTGTGRVVAVDEVVLD